MKKFMIVLMSLAGFVTISCNSAAQPNTHPDEISSLQVIQFHSEHRCISCIKIEKLTRSTLAKHFPGVVFTLINVDEKKNEKMTEQFEATGTALFLYNPKTGKKKDLTPFAFMNVGNETKFDAELKKYIEEFLKS